MTALASVPLCVGQSLFDGSGSPRLFESPVEYDRTEIRLKSFQVGADYYFIIQCDLIQIRIPYRLPLSIQICNPRSFLHPTLPATLSLLCSQPPPTIRMEPDGFTF
jgi:hypothetical protein